ncbi:UxaA family hydrolase [Marinifilum caeruleilacunae]|uniref:Altronate dehydratase n=1 Tax=Marinifilum caeruleilacunae TaxID=2499076 RepID=A0ABX1WZL6_9BACT|nr:altronate dehydratase family protein [Marinifilum caeruleilacunae]NOU61313.1 altronate dehydratase [Marinifilum caeruleilacunae]
MEKFLKIHLSDNVLVATSDIYKGEIISIDDISLKINKDIPAGHKIALISIVKGENVIKYGNPIGYAASDIKPGDHVHVHNVKTNLSDCMEYEYHPKFNDLNFAASELTFKGFKRKNGDVGIRNELWIIPTVGCVNGQAKSIVNYLKQQHHFKNLENLHVFGHTYGCSQLGDDHINTKTALANMVKHPNAGGVLVLGLGCENNQISELKKSLGEYDKERVKFLNCQDVEDEIEEGVKLVENLYTNMQKDTRTDCPLKDLKIGLKCGGSDGFSGITANPLLGVFSDLLIASGGSTVLTEVPEMFGAEHLLMERAENKEVFNKTVNLINDFKEYFIKHNQPIYENPSPGNKAGGITTLEDKSLGCTQKGGSAKIVDVLKYGETIQRNGLNLLSSPGNDLVAASALGFAGCQMVLFTTGRGTPFGSFIPTMKISTNSDLAKRKSHWIDFNAGTILESGNVNSLAEEFLEFVITVASGKELNHEKTGFREIAIFKSGVTL